MSDPLRRDFGQHAGRIRGKAGCQVGAVLALERPVVLAGDWNVVPEDRDVFSVKATQHDALLQPATRAEYRQILAQGWTDALRAFHPRDDKLYTFWD